MNSGSLINSWTDSRILSFWVIKCSRFLLEKISLSSTQCLVVREKFKALLLDLLAGVLEIFNGWTLLSRNELPCKVSSFDDWLKRICKLSPEPLISRIWINKCLPNGGLISLHSWQHTMQSPLWKFIDSDWDCNFEDYEYFNNIVLCQHNLLSAWNANSVHFPLRYKCISMINSSVLLLSLLFA